MDYRKYALNTNLSKFRYFSKSDCKSAVNDFDGSNPSLPTKNN